MKAILLEDVGKLTITEAERPVLDGPDELLIKAVAVGVCGSEIHAFRGTHPFRKTPSIQGHEVTGEVVEVGADVRAFNLEDRVFVDPQWTCGRCEWCRSGRHNLCPKKKVLGTIGWSGGLGEYIVAPEKSVYLSTRPRFLHRWDADRAVGRRRARRQPGSILEPGDSVAALGTGPIGMMVAAVANARGASPIVAVDLQPHCLEIAQRPPGGHPLPAGRSGATDRAHPRHKRWRKVSMWFF